MLSSLSTVGVGVKLLSAKSKDGKAIMKDPQGKISNKK